MGDDKTSINRRTTVNKTASIDAKKKSLKKKRAKQRKRRRIISITIISLIILLIIFLVSINSTLGRMKRTTINDDNLEISDKFKEGNNNYIPFEGIINIALFGIDKEEDNIQRSDAIMVGTLDTTTNKIKVTSFMRDTYVNIPEYGYDKLNHAYAYGGPELAISTLNKNFDLNITDYVTVNFEELQQIIDAIGGIDMSLDASEIKVLNEYLDYLNDFYKKPIKNVYVSKNGKVHLTGFEALAYTRNRSTNGGDFDRTARQRHVMEEMFNKISSSGVAKLTSMINKLLPLVETSLSNSEIVNLSTQVLTLGNYNIEQERFPRNGYCEDSYINGIFYLCYNENITKEQVYEYIFHDNKMWDSLNNNKDANDNN